MRVVVHVGLTKTGTTHLQGLLAAHAPALLGAGVLYPTQPPGLHFRGAVDVRGSAGVFGLTPEEVDGAWQRLCAQAREHVETTGGDAVIGHEVLAGATPEQADRALRALEGLEVHVVVTARDLGRQAVAHWQERVKLGETRSFADFEREELFADSGRDRGPDAGGVRPRFWHGQDFADTLRRWTFALPPERGHLVVCPAPGAPGEELWRRFAEAAGLPEDLVDATADVRANSSLGAAEVALLREVNRRLGDSMPTDVRHRVVKREYAEGELAARDSLPARTPATAAGLLADRTHAWLEEVVAAGHVVHGAVDDLEPVVAGPGDPAPDTDPPADLDPEQVVAMLRTRAEGGSAQTTARRPRWWRRG
ncbi:MAG: hypothetical protein KKE65_07830 [Actinobacteria bacterium]|nr:hypothetical protein [Actinomycetota bacterium]MBU2111551.1 hypothetical protein [Actinomycetota bacterium]